MGELRLKKENENDERFLELVKTRIARDIARKNFRTGIWAFPEGQVNVQMPSIIVEIGMRSSEYRKQLMDQVYKYCLDQQKQNGKFPISVSAFGAS